MTADPHIFLNLNRTGLGVLVIDGVDISGITTEVSVHHDGVSTALTVTMLITNGTVSIEGRQIYSSGTT